MTKLRFTRTHPGRYYAEGDEHTYVVVRDGASWLLWISAADRSIRGVTLSGPDVKRDWHDLKALAVAVANEYERWTPDGSHSSRYTIAVRRAYDAYERGEA